MPVGSGSRGFTVGRDGSIVLIHALAPGGRLDLPLRTSFDVKPSFTKLAVKVWDGTRLHADLPDGWTGSISAERSNADVDLFCFALEAAFFNNIAIPFGFVYQYVNETNGTVTTFQFDLVTFAVTDPGAYSADRTVTQKIDFMANRRRVV